MSLFQIGRQFDLPGNPIFLLDLILMDTCFFKDHRAGYGDRELGFIQLLFFGDLARFLEVIPHSFP